MTLNIGSWKDYASLSKHLYRQVGLNFAVSICCATMLMIVLLLADLRKRVHIVMASYLPRLRFSSSRCVLRTSRFLPTRYENGKNSMSNQDGTLLHSLLSCCNRRKVPLISISRRVCFRYPRKCYKNSERLSPMERNAINYAPIEAE